MFLDDFDDEGLEDGSEDFVGRGLEGEFELVDLFEPGQGLAISFLSFLGGNSVSGWQRTLTRTDLTSKAFSSCAREDLELSSWTVP